jgi:hypothetical protein
MKIKKDGKLGILNFRGFFHFYSTQQNVTKLHTPKASKVLTKHGYVNPRTMPL